MEQHSKDNQIFILDIGTRNVVGIAGHKEGDIFVIDACEAEAHPRRAMIDGQIEDIEQVAFVANIVKRRVEEKLDVTFTEVGIAAAGRALETCRATAQMQLPSNQPITAQTAFSLESAAVNEARLALDTQVEASPYYCVGYSVVRYLLDDYPFSTIIGHRASAAEVEIIATFLPTEVVESLRHCMNLINLEITTMTLEPIAAMRAVIPQDLRLLNLALVDIGAGTSDIALSADGTISGYTMATIAGDEITETIIRKYLVDFATAEQMKLSLKQDAPFSYTDILGFEQQVDTQEIAATIAPAVETLADVIHERIIACNSEAPAAVFMVGGGSKTPGLCALLADKLQLPANRVAMAGTNFSGRIVNSNSGIDDPEYATPLGIALISLDNSLADGASAVVNGQRVRLFNLSTPNVIDILLLAGYTYSDLMGRNGRSLTFTLNGERIVVRGGAYTTAELKINGQLGSFTAAVQDGDRLDIIPAKKGEDAFATVGSYTNREPSITVVLNGAPLLAGTIARVNGTVAPAETPILDQDVVEVFHVKTIGELCEAAGVVANADNLTANGLPADLNQLLQDGDDISSLSDTLNILQGTNVSSASTPKETTDNAAPPAAAEPQALVATALSSESAAPVNTAPLPQFAGMEPANIKPAQSLPAEPPAKPASSSALSFGQQPANAQAHASSGGSLSEAPLDAAKPDSEELVPTATQNTSLSFGMASPTTHTPAPEPEETVTPAPIAGSLRIDLNGKTVILPAKASGETYCVFDVLTLVDIDPANPQGPLELMLNGSEASFVDELRSGDKVNVGWKNTLQ